MNPNEAAILQPRNTQAFDETIGEDSQALGSQLQVLRERLFPPEAKKELRSFSTAETAKLIGVTESYIRNLATVEEGPIPEKAHNGRRRYALGQIHELRQHLTKGKTSYVPWRKDGEHLQVIAVTNFKGGSGKTTTATHLAQYLALRGYRVLAVDLDPQASMSALFGYQPEFDVADNQTLYGSIRYDDERRPLSENCPQEGPISRRVCFMALLGYSARHCCSRVRERHARILAGRGADMREWPLFFHARST